MWLCLREGWGTTFSFPWILGKNSSLKRLENPDTAAHVSQFLQGIKTWECGLVVGEWLEVSTLNSTGIP